MNLFSYSSVFANVCAGLTTGLTTSFYTIAYAALIFSGDLTNWFPQGIGVALIGATLTAIIVAWHSSFPFILAGPEINAVIIITLMGNAIASSLMSINSIERVYPTIWIAIIISTISTGLCLLILGKLGMVQWARFIPYPVVSGFLAGTGWLLAKNSFKMMTGVTLTIEDLHRLTEILILPYWLVGLLFSLILLLCLKHSKHSVTLPALLLFGMFLFNVLFHYLTAHFPTISSMGWFISPFPANDLWIFYRISTFAEIDWPVLITHINIMITMMGIVVISIVLNTTGIELATGTNANLDREFHANGIANLVNGLCGGMIGYVSIGRSLLNHQAGANNPLAGIVAGVFCSTLLIFGSLILTYVPKPILGGLLLYISFNILTRWVYKTWFELPRADYMLIVLILVTISIFGFLQGVGIGIIIACFLFIYNYGRSPVIKYEASGKNYQSNVERSILEQEVLQERGDYIYILVLQNFIFFGTANALIENLCQLLKNQPQIQYVVLDFSSVTGLDSSAIHSFFKINRLAQKYQLNMIFTQVHTRIQHQFIQIDLMHADEKICKFFPDLDRGLEWCENQILEKHQFVDSGLWAQKSPKFLADSDKNARLTSYFEPLVLQKGHFLFREGDLSDGLYFLQSGRVSVILKLPNDRTKRLRTYQSGTILGEMGLYTHSPRSASIIADQISHLHFLSRQAFEKIQLEDPELARSLHQFMVNLLTDRLKNRENELNALLK